MKTRKGGTRVPYRMSSKWHKNYEAISQSPMDCAASSFSLLGYTSWEDSLYLAHRTPNGLATEDVLNILQRAYPRNDVKFRKVNSDRQISEFLMPGEATLGSLGWERPEGGEGGHYFVLHNDGRQIMVIDPQIRVVEPLDDYIKRFKYPHYNAKANLTMITSTDAIDGNNAVTQPIMHSVMRGRYRGRSGIRDRAADKRANGRADGRADDEVGSAYGRPEGRATGRVSEVGHNHGSSDGSYGVTPHSRRDRPAEIPDYKLGDCVEINSQLSHTQTIGKIIYCDFPKDEFIIMEYGVEQQFVFKRYALGKIVDCSFFGAPSPSRFNTPRRPHGAYGGKMFNKSRKK